MAISKLNIEALAQLSIDLQKSIDTFEMTKAEMDELLNSFQWDDPVGRSFIANYYENLKPIDSKLIPNIKSYCEYLNEVSAIIAEDYAGTNAQNLPYGRETSSVGFTPKSISLVDADINIEHEIHGFKVKLVPIANGCGTDNKWGRMAGQLGAGVDSLSKTSSVASAVTKGATIVGKAGLGAFVAGTATLVGLGALGNKIEPDGVEQLNEGACNAHDVCYFEQKGKEYCDEQFAKDAPISASYVKKLGESAYQNAGKERMIHNEIEREMRKIGKKAPAGYRWAPV